MGDMNASIPKTDKLNRNWYKSHPYNGNSMLLYDLIVDNNLTVSNFNFDQSVEYTFFNKNNRSYIDHVLASEKAWDWMVSCRIRDDFPDNTSDHFPVISRINLPLLASRKECSGQNMPTHPRINWSDSDMCQRYSEVVMTTMSAIERRPIDLVQSEFEAQSTVNQLCSQVTEAIHTATAQVNDRESSKYKGRYRKNSWWNNTCLIARDRHRFWFNIWKSCDRPKQGQVYICHKHAKKAYRQACRTSMNTDINSYYRRLDKLYCARDSKTFWNLIRTNKLSSNKTENNINIRELTNHFREKFTCISDVNSDTVKQAQVAVTKHSNLLTSTEILQNKDIVSRGTLQTLIKSLKMGCAPGFDGVVAEHLLYALNSDFTNLFCDILNLSLKFSVVPDNFTQGILVPLLKKPTSDASVANNYRPIVISSTYSKVMEKYILCKCDNHEFSGVQFGFVEGRGTELAVALPMM